MVSLGRPEPLTNLNPHAPAPLEWIVERCLSMASGDRFGSTEALRREFGSMVTRATHRVTDTRSINNLPEPRTSLIGREAELAELGELIADPNPHVLTLTGPGGIGKTRLAVELGHLVAGRFAGGACFVQLENVSDSSLVASQVALALGITESPRTGVETAIENHIRYLPGPLFLLLDNFEHVLEAAVFVARLVSDRVKVVVTSRAPLRVYGEYEFAVPSLSWGHGGRREEIEQSPAVRLFRERATGLARSTMNEEQLRIVSEICGQLDGVPLAIELAAARTRLFSLRALKARLDTPLAVLVGGARDLHQRQHTMRATLDWSYNLLNDEHRKLFRRMAVFAGGATIEAIEAVCDTRRDLNVKLWDAIELLASNSLVRRIDADDSEPRFALLETMREYGIELLAAAGEENYTRKAHAAYFLVLAEEQGRAIRRERTGKHPFDADRGNFRASLDWLVAAGEVEWGLRLVIALAVYFQSLRLHSEALDRVSRLLALPHAEQFVRLRNYGKYWQAAFACEACHAHVEVYRAAFKLFEEAGDENGMFQAAGCLSTTLKFADSSEAQQWAERVVEMARASGDMARLAGALSNLADVVRISDFTYSQALYTEAMHLFEACGSEENAIWSVSHQADLYRDSGNTARARSLYRDALKGFRRLGVLHGVAASLHDLAGLELADGRILEAQHLCQEALQLYGPENPADLPRVLESMVELAICSRQHQRALTLAGAAAAIRKRFDVWSMDPARRAHVENQIEPVRKDAGALATTFWMRGWNMRLEEIIEFAAREAADTWTTS